MRLCFGATGSRVELAHAVGACVGGVHEHAATGSEKRAVSTLVVPVTTQSALLAEGEGCPRIGEQAGFHEVRQVVPRGALAAEGAAEARRFMASARAARVAVTQAPRPAACGQGRE